MSLCWLFHKWGNWTELAPLQVTYHYPLFGRSHDATLIEQARKCERCGLVQRKEIR